MTKSYRILSIDGGGIRGIMPSIWLDCLEKKLGSPICNHFDLIIGTSIGAIIGCAASAEIPMSQMIKFFEIDGAKVFPSFIGRIGYKIMHPLGPLYPSSGIENLLKSNFGDKTFGELKTQTLAISYAISTGYPHVFSSINNKDYKVWEVCRASSAAPVFFSPHIMEYKGEKTAFIDGSVVSNNPSQFALAKYLEDRESKDQRPFIVSIGCGSPDYKSSPEEIKNWNLIKWLSNVVRIVFDGTSDGTHYFLETNPKINKDGYYRLQTFLPENLLNIDNASASNIAALKLKAEDYFEQNEYMFDEIVSHLKSI